MKIIKNSIELILMIFLSLNLLVASRLLILPAKANPYDQIAEYQKKIKELQAQSDALNNQIKKEQENQNNLAQQSKILDKAIQQNEIQIKSLELELEKVELEIKVLKEEQTKLQNRIAELQESLTKATNELNVSINLLYKLSLSNLGILSENSSFQDSIVNEEKERSTIRIIKAKIKNIKDLENEVLAKKEEISSKEKQVSELKAQLEAKANNLDMQQQALKWQKENKQKLISLSKQNERSLSEKQKETSQQLMTVQANLASIINSLLNTPMSGSYVRAGQVIGFQGRTGLSCAPYNPSLVPVRTNNYCSAPWPKGAGLSSYWYYYDPVKFPEMGSHLHFVYKDNKPNSCGRALDALRNPGNKIFDSMPMASFTITQGCHNEGAIDIDGGHGSPVYAVKAGYVTYKCIRFPNDPSFPDPAFAAIVHHVNAAGEKDGTVSVYVHLKRNIPCDGIWAN